MRTVLAVGIAVVMLFVGIQGLAVQADTAQGAAVDNGTNDTAAAYNLTNDVVGGAGTAFGPALVWMGVAAVVLVSLGVLVTAYGGGGR